MPQTVSVDPSGLNLTTTLTYDAQGDPIQVDGPRSDVTDVAYYSYDLDRRPVFAIQPDPDGAGPHPRPAHKTLYDLEGRILEVDSGTTTLTTGADFSTLARTQNLYNVAGEKIETTTPTTVTQFSFDGAGRPLCTAHRLNPAMFASLPTDACTLGTSGSYGPDRITKTIYDAAGQARQEIRAFGTSVQQVYATHDFSLDGLAVAVADADANIPVGSYNLDETAPHPHQTNYAFDGFDRLATTTYADATTDKVTLYDADGNAKTRVNRSGQSFSYTYDKNGHALTKVVPAYTGHAADTVSWSYDLVNEVTALSDTNGNVLANTYDLAGRQLTAAQTIPGMAGGAKTVVYAYDNGMGDKSDRSKITWPDGYYVAYAYDALGHMLSAADSGGAVLATRTYDNLARPATIQYPSANDNMAYSWSPENDLLTLADNFAGSANDVNFTNTFTPVHQIADSVISNAAFRFAPSISGADSYASANGLNQYMSMTPAGGTAQTISYDTRGNLTGDGTFNFSYDPENRLVGAAKTGMSASYAYDPLGRRKSKTVNATTTNFLHDSDTEIAEYDGTGALLRRFIPGPVIDEPIAMVTAAGVKTFFHTDKMGSVIAMSDATGHLAEGPYTYDSYGNCAANGTPCATGEPYRYTGQRLDPETGLLYYRARYYSSVAGRFLQTDPVGYTDDLNMYVYVHNDPMNGMDPTGLACESKAEAAGTCIDAPNYDKAKDGDETVQSNSKIDDSAKQNMPSLETVKDGQQQTDENHAQFKQGDDGTVTFKPLDGDTKPTSFGVQGTFHPDDDADAVGHSHPQADGFVIAPGPGDSNPVEQGKPNYIVHNGKIIVVEKVDGQYQVRLITGKLTSADRHDIRMSLQNFQEDSR